VGDDRRVAVADRWNHNIHYHPVIVGALPSGCAPETWPPPESFTGTRRIAARVLPGSRFRRHVLWRYSLVWTKA
jgi:hypothetical protein